MSRSGAAGIAVAVLAALTGCATKGQVKLLEGELRSMRIESARRDSARASALAAVITLQQRILDSVVAGREALKNFDVRISNDMTDLQRQLLQVQELTGQSQQRLTQLKAQIDQRAEQAEVGGPTRPPTPGDTSARPTAGTVPTADQMYRSARDQHGRGALATARMAYQEVLKTYPGDPRVPDVLFYIGETFAGEAPDSAVVYYAQVPARFRTSPRAPTALYRLGRLEEARRNPAAARGYYDRLVRDYPTSDDADLARERLKNLRP